MNKNQQGPIFAALEIAAATNDPTANDEEPTLQSMPVELLLKERRGSIATKAYYLSVSDDVNFRHAGISGQSPPCLYLNDLTSYGDNALVYYSSSGSGKTSELVGSSATRGAHLAIVMAAHEQDYQHMDHNFDHNIEEAASLVITSTLTELLSTRSARTSLLPVVQAALSAEKALKLVLSIDEASSCPKVIHGITRSPELVKSCVLQALDQGLNSDLRIQDLKLEVSVSIGGTGIASSTIGSTIGSLPANFTVLTPSHEDIWAKVVDSTLSNLKLSLAVPWNADRETFSSFNDIENRLPVVSELMKMVAWDLLQWQHSKSSATTAMN